jgi:hypothetical protein
MPTLERWTDLLQSPYTLVFPQMELAGRDGDPPLIEGSGELRLIGPATFEFTLSGLPENPEYTAEQFRAQKRAPYDPLARFRLFGTDEQGCHWALGWTVPQVNSGPDEWTLTGRTDGLATVDQSPSVSELSSTELLFLIPPNHNGVGAGLDPMDKQLLGD